MPVLIYTVNSEASALTPSCGTSLARTVPLFLLRLLLRQEWFLICITAIGFQLADLCLTAKGFLLGAVCLTFWPSDGLHCGGNTMELIRTLVEEERRERNDHRCKI